MKIGGGGLHVLEQKMLPPCGNIVGMFVFLHESKLPLRKSFMAADNNR